MHIDYDLLMTYGGVTKKFAKGEFIFHEGSLPHYYHQLISGEIKMYSTNTEGRELIQAVLKPGQSFGEPPLLVGKAYPSSAEVCAESVVVRMRKEHFQNILSDYPELIEKLMYAFAARLYLKATAAQVWVQHTPEEKILQFLCNEKANFSNRLDEPLPYTRQEIADFIGVRVETVIRTLTRMNKDGKVRILDHKLYYV